MGPRAPPGVLGKGLVEDLVGDEYRGKVCREYGPLAAAIGGMLKYWRTPRLTPRRRPINIQKKEHALKSSNA